jgi:hypothetical protein
VSRAEPKIAVLPALRSTTTGHRERLRVHLTKPMRPGRSPWWRRRAARVVAAALLVGLPLISFATPAGADFGCGTALMRCQVQLDNSGRAWFDSVEKLTEDALGDGTLRGGVIQVYERSAKTTSLVKGPDGNPIPSGTHSTAARLLGVSPSGERIYILTQAPLTPDDLDPTVGDSATDGYEISGGRFHLLTTGPIDKPSDAPFANNGGWVLWASADGAHVYFQTSSQMTPDDWDSFSDIYQRTGSQTRLVSTGPDETLPTFEFPNPFIPDMRFLGASPDGATAYFATAAHLTADEPGKSVSETRLLTSDIFAWNGGVTHRITRTVSPEEAPGTPWEAFDPYSFAGAGEGSIYFTANSGHVPEDTDSNRDVYRAGPDHSLERVISSPVSANPAEGVLAVEAVSRDGNRLFLRSGARHVPADRDSEADVYIWSDGRYQLVTPRGDLREAHEEELHLCSISADGRRAYFQTWASLSSLDTDSEPDVYEWSEGRVRLVSPASDGRQSAAFCSGISPNGRFVAFSTWEELVPGDNDVKQDVYVIDMGPVGAAGASASRAKGVRARGRHRKRRKLRLVTAEAIAPRMRVSHRGSLRSDGSARLRLRCPRLERSGPCRGRVWLLTRGRRKLLAKGRFRIRAGKRGRVHLTGTGISRVKGSLDALARVRASDLLGNTATVRARVLLRRVSR